MALAYPIAAVGDWQLMADRRPLTLSHPYGLPTQWLRSAVIAQPLRTSRDLHRRRRFDHGHRAPCHEKQMARQGLVTVRERLVH
jgi:hypothetical protein